MTNNKGIAYREIEEIKIKGKPGEPEREVFARASLSPVMNAAVTQDELLNPEATFDIADLMVVLDRQVSKTLDSPKLVDAQRMLAGQAHTLDAIFNHLSLEAIKNLERDHSTLEMCLKLALRAQSQCRSTWLAVSEIRNPRLAHVVNQANIAGGHQQVNNQIAPNELLGAENERMDTRAPQAPVRADSPMEAVGAVNGAKKRRGEG